MAMPSFLRLTTQTRSQSTVLLLPSSEVLWSTTIQNREVARESILRNLAEGGTANRSKMAGTRSGGSLILQEKKSLVSTLVKVPLERGLCSINLRRDLHLHFAAQALLQTSKLTGKKTRKNEVEVPRNGGDCVLSFLM